MPSAVPRAPSPLPRAPPWSVGTGSRSPAGDPDTLPFPADGSEGVAPDTPKMLKLAEQCLERVKSIAAALGE